MHFPSTSFERSAKEEESNGNLQRTVKMHGALLVAHALPSKSLSRNAKEEKSSAAQVSALRIANFKIVIPAHHAGKATCESI